MDDFEKEIKLSFLEEAGDHVEIIEEGFLEIEQGRASEDLIAKVFRSAHNLKGASQAVGFNDFGEFIHKVENAIVGIRDGQITVNSDVVTVLLEASDHLKNYVTTLNGDLNGTYDTLAIQNKLIDLTKNHKDAPETLSTPAAPQETAPPPSEELTPQSSPPPALETTAAPQRARHSSPPAPQESTSPGRPSSNRREDLIKVGLQKLDRVLNLVGELVVYQNILNETRKAYLSEGDKNLNDVISRLNTIVTDLQDSSFGLRMMPLQTTFNKIRRIVRDIGAKQQKDIEFKIEGEWIEMDKSVVDGISEPLVHLIRNGIDHGIEPSPERLQLGKSEKAHLKLTAHQDAGKVIIEVSDDGRGLQKDKIRDKAIANGLLKPTDQLEDEELYRLIFNSGFSTKEQVTEVSGRGVGMDVVRKNIEELNGEIYIESNVNQGTSFHIHLPLSVAIIDGMVCEVEAQRYIVPLSSLNEVHQVETSQVASVNQKSLMVRVRDEEVPMFDLSDILKKQRHTESNRPEGFFAITSMVNGRKYMFKVNRLLGVQQIVIKQLGPEFQGLPGLAGSAVLGDGSAGLILDIPSLVNNKIVRAA